MNIKSVFLNGHFQEVYMEQSKGFIVEGEENLVCKSVKALHGLKQDPQGSYEKIDKYLRSSSL